MEQIFSLSNYSFNPHTIPNFIISIFLLFLGIFVFSQNRKSITNLAYLITCASATWWLLVNAIVMSSNEGAHTLFWSKFVYIGVTLIPPSMYFFGSSWLNLMNKRKKIILFNYLLGAVFIILFFSTDKFVIGYQRHFFGSFSRLGSLGLLYLTYFFGVSIAFFLDLIKSYFKETDAIKKIHKKWVSIAFLVAFIGSTEFLITYGINIYPVGCFTIILFSIIVAYSIIRYKLMDIETVLHKTVAWFFTNLILIIPFIALIYFTRSWYEGLNNLSTLSFLGILSLLFLFFVRALQPKIDHFFQRRRSNLEEIANQFIGDVVHLKGVDKLIQCLEDTIADTLYPQRINIFIYDENKRSYKLRNKIDKFIVTVKLNDRDAFLQWLAKNNKIVYKEFIDIDPKYASVKEKVNEYFDLTEANVAVPLVLDDRLIGIINLGKKGNLRRYSALDFHFLTILKNESTIAISNSLLYENIENQVRQKTKELVEVQKQLIQAEKLATVGTLAGGVAHEINNPLTAILTNVQMLLSAKDTPDIDSARESLELIEEATKRCRTIVQKLMTYAKRPLESAEFFEVDLLNVLKNVVSLLGYQLEQDNIKIVTKIEKDTCQVIGNQNELEQVVTNIVLNAKDAIKRIKKSGTVYISLSKNDDWIKIAIKDEGIGMPKEIVSRIFDPFFTTKEVGKGVGLGLSICQAIVGKHNGLITVQSEPNKGSIFTIQLPKIQERSTVKSEAKL